jgi:hypothetical protein
MDEYSLYWSAFRAAIWRDEDPAKCGCRGTGYALSEVDTWHECPIHWREGQRHPLDEDDDNVDSETARCETPPAPIVPANDDADIPF